MKDWNVLFLFLYWLVDAVQSVVSHDSSSPPNIVVFLADNLGYTDISWLAEEKYKHNRTPNIDSLGRDGLTFLNWNSAAHLCSASRAALLTGQYPARTGVYPGVFHPDAASGMNATTLATHLKELGYSTSIVGKWHLGHRPQYLPTQFGFDEYLGIPYHMSGGSIDNHTCVYDTNRIQWLPLYKDKTIIQQPVKTEQLAETYAKTAKAFVERNQGRRPFFLFMAFSHVHQLCASAEYSEQKTCQWARTRNPSFADAVSEMDWIAGEILQSIEQTKNNTLVVFTSDNGPWVAERSCSGLSGIFKGQWYVFRCFFFFLSLFRLRENVPLDCTACPHDYVPDPTPERPRQCTMKSSDISMEGVHCGDDTGLGSVWEANLRMPTLIRWPGKIQAKTNTSALVSSLDLVPTILSVVNSTRRKATKKEILDGVDISSVLFGQEGKYDSDNRILFFWRDGFLRDQSPLGPPYGRFDVVAAKLGRYKAWFSTKSAHYNADLEDFHDPPLLFDTISDPAESKPIAYPFQDDSNFYTQLVKRIKVEVAEHKKNMSGMYPRTLQRDARYIPCSDPDSNCRTDPLSNENGMSTSPRLA